MTVQNVENFLLNKIKHVIVGGVKTACLSSSELVAIMIEDCKAHQRSKLPSTLVFDTNGHALSLAATSASFKEYLHQADIIHADGGVIVTATNRLTDGHIGSRSATTDFIHHAAEAAAKNKLSFYLFGGTEEVNSACAIKLQETYPGLKIAGRRNGYFTEQDEAEICADINRSQADIVWVGLGKPKEQKFCVDHRNDIKASWLISCGGCYNYITNDYPRAPLWMQNNGLEWLFRMCTDPRKLFLRYLTTNPHALYLLATKTQKTIIN